MANSIHHKTTCMKNVKWTFCLFFLLSGPLFIWAQPYKAGEKVEARINNSWKSVSIVKQVTGKNNLFEVQLLGTTTNSPDAGKKILVTADNLRKPLTANIATATDTKTNTVYAGAVHLGKYELYSGIPSMYLGQLILEKDGKYRIAFNTDEDNFDTGTYVFHPENSTIEWTSGMFRNNNWGGKYISRGSGAFRIEFNKATFAESN
jgi:hypothetical protein